MSYTTCDEQIGANLILRSIALLIVVPILFETSHWYRPDCRRDTRCRTRVWLLLMMPDEERGVLCCD